MNKTCTGALRERIMSFIFLSHCKGPYTDCFAQRKADLGRSWSIRAQKVIFSVRPAAVPLVHSHISNTFVPTTDSEFQASRFQASGTHIASPVFLCPKKVFVQCSERNYIRKETILEKKLTCFAKLAIKS